MVNYTNTCNTCYVLYIQLSLCNFRINFTDGKKAKAVPLHTTKDFGGRKLYLLLILDFGTRWGEWSASLYGRGLAAGKGPLIPIVQEAGWTPDPVWTQKLEEKFFRICRGSNVDCPVVQPIARHYTDWATRLINWELLNCIRMSLDFVSPSSF
jgi:hypothetical protein